MSEQPPTGTIEKKVARSTPRSWIRVASNALPARWVTIAALALFLAVTAAFGGLADAPSKAETPLAQLAAGDVHDTGEFEIRLDRAVLIDELDGSGTYPDEGERVLAVVGTIRNTTNEPIESMTIAANQLHAEGLPDTRPNGDDMETAVARFDDTTYLPVLQPGFEVELAFTWAVPGDLLHADDELALTLSDKTWFQPSFLSKGPGSWTTPYVPAAVVRLTIEDVGAGAEPEDGT
jgi:hypothetical protein